MKRGYPALVLLCLGCSSDDPTNPSLVEVSIDPAVATVEVGATWQFTATVAGTENVEVIWAVVEGPDHGTTDSTGLYTAPVRVPGPGTATVRATSLADPEVSATAEVALSAHEEFCGLKTFRQVPVNFEGLKGKWFAEIEGVNAAAEYLWFESDTEIRLAIVAGGEPEEEVPPDCRLITTSIADKSTMEVQFEGGSLLTRWTPLTETCCDPDHYGGDVLRLEGAGVLDEVLTRIPVLVEVLDPDARHCSRFPALSPTLRPVLQECTWE